MVKDDVFKDSVPIHGVSRCKQRFPGKGISSVCPTLDRLFWVSVTGAIMVLLVYKSWLPRSAVAIEHNFFAKKTSVNLSCATNAGRLLSHSGFIGLDGDTPGSPKRSFFCKPPFFWK